MSKSLLGWWVQHCVPTINFLQQDPPQTSEKEETPVIVFNGEKKYNISPFLNNHPGGSKVLCQFVGKDIRNKMRGSAVSHTHSKMAYSLLEDYIVTDSKVHAIKERTEPEDMFAKEKQELEDLVDWNKGMISQVGSLGTAYEDWLNFPVDRPLYIFDSPFLERLTRTPWYAVPIVWCPVAVLLLVISARYFGRAIGVWILPGWLSGVFLWSFLEYLLHRFLFHMTPPKNQYFIMLHFLLHGVHHKVPFDQDRLVFPPMGTLLISWPIFTAILYLLPLGPANLLMSGLLSGYIFYDLCHYYIHHGEPAPSSYFHDLKRYHANHHFLHQTQGYGITSKLWDNYFGTTIILK